jgi:hypothetical protein
VEVGTTSSETKEQAEAGSLTLEKKKEHERIEDIRDAHPGSSEIDKIIANWEREHADNPKAISRLKRITKRSNDKIKHMLLAPLQILMARGYQGTT